MSDYNPIIELESVILNLKETKDLDPKWRNKAVARIEEAQAFIRSAMIDRVHEPQGECICLPGLIDSECPVHGKL